MTHIIQEKNRKVLTDLSRSSLCEKYPDAVVIAPWNSVPDPYTQCGTHPEVVEQLWDIIGSALPEDCRALVYYVPALVHPKSGLIFGVGLGTSYGLRLPGGVSDEAVKAGARIYTKYSTGAELDIRNTFGEDWVFGEYLPDEVMWCKISVVLLEDVIRKVMRDFSESERLPVLQLLTEFRMQNPQFSDRVLRCVVLLANGSFDEFARVTTQARLDWRDLVAAAENSDSGGEEGKRRDFNLPFSD